MRNKLKRRKIEKTTPPKDQANAVIVLPESICTDDKTSQESHSAANRENIRISCKKGVQIAPIFLSALQHKKSKLRSDGGFARDTQKSSFIPQNDVKSSLTASHLPVPHGSAASTCRGHLSAEALHTCLEEIRILNPAFSVQTVFSSLQKKAREGSTDSSQNHLDEERKQGRVTSGKVPKRLQAADADSCSDEVLWTDKYSPQRSGEVIGNAAAVDKLLSWLKKWKLRADCDERRETEERKRDENDSWDCGDFQGETGAEMQGEASPSNAMLITGPSGVGKTASVYACAQELGFKVFEVNSSSQRSGRHVLSQLMEATQSHLVETSGTDPLKPAYFSPPTSEALPGKLLRPKNATSTLKKRPARSLSSSGRRVKAKPDTLTLAHFFRMKDEADRFHFGKAVEPLGEELGNQSLDWDRTAQRSKRTATSLILFEEVDVVFDDDVGFLAAIKAFMTTAKRPIILTTGDPSFKERFDRSLEEIIFKTPSAVSVSSYLQLVCLAEEAALDRDAARSLYALTCGDVRRCLLQLQLGVLGGEGFPDQTCPRYPQASEGNSLSSTWRSADTLVLHSVTPNYLLSILKWKSWSEADMDQILKTFSESWRRGAPLVYSNLELLLHLGATGTSHPDKTTNPEPRCSGGAPHVHQNNQNSISRVSFAPSGPARTRLSRKKFKARVHDTQSSSSWTNKIQLSFNRTPRDTAKPKAVTNDLDALTNLFDLMSYLDAALPGTEPPVPGPCTPDSFVWTGAALKDGLLDETSEEDGSSSRRREELVDIKAAVEGLGCHICFQKLSEARTGFRTRAEEQRRDGLMEGMQTDVSSGSQRLTSSPLCASRASRRRFKLSRMLLSCKYFSLQGNKRAVCVDVMPMLRWICRFLQAEPVRCGNYLSSLGLSHSTLKLLTEDFNQRKVWKDD